MTRRNICQSRVPSRNISMHHQSVSFQRKYFRDLYEHSKMHYQFEWQPSNSLQISPHNDDDGISCQVLICLTKRIQSQDSA